MYTIRQLRINIEQIKTKSGIYVWSFSPNINYQTKDLFIKSLNRITGIKTKLPRIGNVWTTKVKLISNSFRDGDKYFSEHSIKNSQIMILSEELQFRKYFAKTIKTGCEITIPLYIGKANNLRERISDHINERNSTLLEDFSICKIREDEVRLRVFEEDENIRFGNKENISLIVEEFLQRLADPGLVRRYG